MIRPTPRRVRIGRGALGAFVALAVAAGLGGCGKHGALRPPPGKEREFQYPRKYPGTPHYEPPIKPATAPKKGDKSDTSDTSGTSGASKAETGASQTNAKTGTTE